MNYCNPMLRGIEVEKSVIYPPPPPQVSQAFVVDYGKKCSLPTPFCDLPIQCIRGARHGRAIRSPLLHDLVNIESGIAQSKYIDDHKFFQLFFFKYLFPYNFTAYLSFLTTCTSLDLLCL